MRLFLLLLLLPVVVLAARNPKKCGHALVERSERQHSLGFRVARMPSACDQVVLPPKFHMLQIDGRVEIWRELERLVQAVDTREWPYEDPLPYAKKVGPPGGVIKRSKEIRQEYWMRRDGHTVHVTESDREDPQ
jgi:hypothetical protein